MRSPLCSPDTLRCRLSASFAKRAILRHEQGRCTKVVLDPQQLVIGLRRCERASCRGDTRRRAVEVQEP